MIKYLNQLPKIPITRPSLRLLPQTRCLSDEKKADFYGDLGVHRSATQTEIKQAYYDLTKRYHPDITKGDAEASAKFRAVTEAYEILSNYALRKRYDKGLPLPTYKWAPSTDPLEMDVKYQKFYDSRLKTRPIVQRPKKISLGQQAVATHIKYCEEKFEESKKQKNVVLAVIVLYFIVFTAIRKEFFEYHPD